MSRIGSRDTRPELKLRRALWNQGLRYRIHRTDLPGTPDIVFSSRRVVIFVDGDFWHGRQWRLRGLATLDEQFSKSANSAYWVAKIRRNISRDRRVTRSLKRMGWRVIRCWESELDTNFESCVQMVTDRIYGKDIR